MTPLRVVTWTWNLTDVNIPYCCWAVTSQRLITFVLRLACGLHSFYKPEDSYLSHGGDSSEKTAVVGQAAIKQHFSFLATRQRRTEVKDLVCQAAPTGIVLQVIGWQQDGDTPARKFSQTFFLARQVSASCGM